MPATTPHGGDHVRLLNWWCTHYWTILPFGSVLLIHFSLFAFFFCILRLLCIIRHSPNRLIHTPFSVVPCLFPLSVGLAQCYQQLHVVASDSVTCSYDEV
jgi:hypothetical protein